MGVRYVPPFEVLRGFVTITMVGEELTVTAPYDDFIEMIRTFIGGVEVDEAWYLEQYGDIAEAAKAGAIGSGKQHFLRNGYFEGRLPFPVKVDEQWYLEQNPGVADFIQKGLLETCQQHFDENGYLEGRLPFGL